MDELEEVVGIEDNLAFYFEGLSYSHNNMDRAAYFDWHDLEIVLFQE